MELVDLIRVDFRDVVEAYKWDRSNITGVLEKQDLLARARKNADAESKKMMLAALIWVIFVLAVLIFGLQPVKYVHAPASA